MKKMKQQQNNQIKHKGDEEIKTKRNKTKLGMGS